MDEWRMSKDEPTIMHWWIEDAIEEGIVGKRIQIWFSYVVLPRE